MFKFLKPNGRGCKIHPRLKGATSIEYVVLLVCIALASLVAFGVAGKSIGGIVNNTKDMLIEKVDNATSDANGESGSGPTYEIIDGDKDGKHYHNDALFTGTCLTTGKEYETGVEKPTVLTAQQYADNSKGLVLGTIDKGELIQINGKEYRILAVNGTEIKVLAMDNYGDSIKFNSSSVTTSFNGATGQKYEGSNLDAKMTEFYNSLSYKDAIVAQNINQSMYSGTNYTLSRTGEVNVGERFVYALDVDDVLEYLGTGFTWQQLNNMFFKTTSSIIKSVWLRSANAVISDFAFIVDGYSGNLSSSGYNNTFGVRPAFVLDLSKLG